MGESRAVRGGKVYRQLFDAQVQLSRSLLAGWKDMRTTCLSAEDSNTHCSTTSRLLCPPCSRGQQADDVGDDVVDDVSRLPDSVVGDQQSCDIIERLTAKTKEKHKEALKHLERELTHISEVCEAQVRAVSLQLLSSLQDVDLRLNTLKDRMDHLEQLEHLSGQEVCALWEEVQDEVQLKETRIMDLNQRLTDCETQRTHQIRFVLRKFLHLLEKISFLSTHDVCRLMHNEATMLNQSVLANRRSVARLLLLLQEEKLQQESLLRQHWQDCLGRWRRCRVSQVIDRFRIFCSSDEDQQLVSGQLVSSQLVSGQLVSGQLVSGQLVSGLDQEGKQDLLDQRCDIISKICSLAPPSCSSALVSDWFNQLTAINQQIDSLHADLLHQLRCSYEQVWQQRLVELESCQEALSAFQLSEEEVNNIISSQLLPLIGRSQRQDEEQLAAVDLCSDSEARHALSLSRCVFVVMRGAALLWETHSRRLERRIEELQQHLDDLRGSQQEHIQRKKERLDDLLGGLRQESSEDALKTSLDKTVTYLQDVKHSCMQNVSDQKEVLDLFPSLLLEELLSYSSSLSSFYLIDHAYQLSPEELQNLLPSSTEKQETMEGADQQKLEQMRKKNDPISCVDDPDPSQPSQDWLAEAESSLLELYDIGSDVMFTSSRGEVYSCPTLRCPTSNLQQGTHLSLFPVQLLIQSLGRIRTLFFDHLEQHFHDVLSSAVTMVTDRKEALSSEQELQLQQLNPQQIQKHIYEPRLAELLLHRQQVDVHCEEVLDMLASCRVELHKLQTSISRKNQDFTVSLSNMEEDVLMADSSHRLEAVSSTLQDHLDQHIKDTQRCQTSFKMTVHLRLEEVRTRTSQLLTSFRLFSEGGDFAPQEVKLFQRRLKEETKQISVMEESIFSELEVFESRSLKQVKEASSRLEEKLSFFKAEVNFKEKVQRVFNRTRVHLKAEEASSNQQQSSLNSRLEDLRRIMEDTQVCPDQVCSFLSSVSEDLRKRCKYLDLSLDPTLQERPSARPKSSRPDVPQTCRTSVDPLDDTVVGVIKFLNRFSKIQHDGPAETEDRGRPAAGQSLVQRLPQKASESTSSLSVRRTCRSIRTDRRFQVFGTQPEQSPYSFSSMLTSVLFKANDVLLMVAEDFYQTERCSLSRFLLVPDSFDQWAESMQQRLLGYLEQARKFLRTSREELLTQLSVWEELLRLFPIILIGNHERWQGAGFIEEMGRVRLKLEEMLAASKEDKLVNVRQLRASLREDELQALDSREELRQQQLQSAVSCTHLEVQVCVKTKGEEFVTSLASLTEKLLHLLDNLLSPEEIKAAQHSEASAVPMETEAERAQKQGLGSRTWPGIHFLSPLTNSTAAPADVTTATASITTTRCTMGHLAVIEQRDAAVQRFQLLLRGQLSRSEDDIRKKLSELHTWNQHWRHQIDTITHTHII